MHHACGEQYRSAESQRMESSGGISQRAIALQTLTIPYLENPTGGRKMWNIRQLMRALSMRGGHKLLQYSSCGRSPQKRRREAAENTGGDLPNCIIISHHTATHGARCTTREWSGRGSTAQSSITPIIRVTAERRTSIPHNTLL